MYTQGLGRPGKEDEKIEGTVGDTGIKLNNNHVQMVHFKAALEVSDMI